MNISLFHTRLLETAACFTSFFQHDKPSMTHATCEHTQDLTTFKNTETQREYANKGYSRFPFLQVQLHLKEKHREREMSVCLYTA